jgi:hypothetical protein
LFFGLTVANSGVSTLDPPFLYSKKGPHDLACGGSIQYFMLSFLEERKRGECDCGTIYITTSSRIGNFSEYHIIYHAIELFLP